MTDLNPVVTMLILNVRQLNNQKAEDFRLDIKKVPAKWYR